MRNGRKRGLKSAGITGWFRELEGEIATRGAARRTLREGGDITPEGVRNWARKRGIVVQNQGSALLFAVTRQG